ncbi:MAG: hypothetical protein ACRENM_04715 [Candidatus Dormibacteraceae bacterium]
MEPSFELERVRLGSLADLPPEAEVLAQPAAHPEPTLARIREVMTSVLEHSADEWPGLDRWRELLPRWFVDSCVEDSLVRNCVVDVWSLRAWIYWFQPQLRKWHWWGAATQDGQVSVAIEIDSKPYRKAALEWLLKVSSEPSK